MRRGRRTTEATDGFSLFPFLAVLLCTMGALIVLLVVIAQMARAQAQEVLVRVDADAEAARRRHAELLSMAQELAERRRAAESAAAAEQDTVAQLRGRLDDLLAQLADAQRAVRQQQPVAVDERSLDDARRRLAWFQRKIVETMQQLRDAERRADEKSFAVVPYAGRNGTRRRPIYIECRKDSVVLQPTGLEFTEDDFALDQSGGPLETALRATLRYLEQTGQSQVETPYPMLLVRPDGVAAYYAALDTVAELDLEYGYELVDDDWELAYEPPDAQLAQLQAQAVYKARDVQRRLLAARGRGASRRSQAFQLGSSGSLQSVDGSDGGFGEGDGGYAAAGDGGDSGPARAFAAPSGDGGLGSGPNGVGGTPGSGGGPEAFAGESSQSRTPYDPSGIGPGRSQGEGGFTTGGGDGDGFTTLLGQGGEGRRGRGQTGGGTTPGGNAQYNGPDGDDASGSGSGPMVSERPLNGGPGGGGESGSAIASQGSAAAGQPGAATGAADHASGGSASINAGGGTQQAIAKQRGFNWALPGARGKTTAIARPIDVALTGDALAILGRPQAPPRAVIRFRRDTVASVDELQRAVDQVIDSWGIAGGGMYWKPILRVQLAPDGVGRYHDLRALMQGSGIDLEAVAPQAQAGAYPLRPMR